MHRLFVVCCAFGILGCASISPKKESAFFPLPQIEGIVPADGPVWLDGWKFWVGLVVAKPEKYKGMTVMFRFESADDPNYRLLTSHRGGGFRISANDGEGVFSRGAIIFTSHHPVSVMVLPKTPNQSPEPTAGLRPAAAHL